MTDFLLCENCKCNKSFPRVLFFFSSVIKKKWVRVRRQKFGWGENVNDYLTTGLVTQKTLMISLLFLSYKHEFFFLPM